MKSETSENVVYVIGPPMSNRVKIGTSGSVGRRLPEIQRSSPLVLELLWHTPGDMRLEKALHRRFKDKRIHGEWFDFGDEDPVEAISAAVEELRAGQRSIGTWADVGAFDGDLEQGALRFLQGTVFLHAAVGAALERGASELEMDRLGEILFYACDALAGSLQLLSELGEAYHWDARATGLGAAAEAALGVRDCTEYAVHPEYWWAPDPMQDLDGGDFSRRPPAEDSRNARLFMWRLHPNLMPPPPTKRIQPERDCPDEEA